MPTSDITKSELVKAMADVGTLLTGPEPVDVRMNGLCLAAAAVLNCSHIVILELEGDDYCARYQYGLSDELQSQLQHFRRPRSKRNIAMIENCDGYLLIRNAATEPAFSTIAAMTKVRGMVFAPFTHPDGSPLGYLAVGYTHDKPDITTFEAELATAVARLAQTTMLREVEIRRRREISQTMLQVADSERRRLSRDIHDDPLQRILGLRIGLEGFRARLTDPEQQGAIDSFITQCRSASASLREVMLRTHPNASELADLAEVLQAMVERHNDSAQIDLRYSDNRSATSPQYLIPAINRIAEQAARNTLRHAGASVLGVALTDKSGGTLLTITDDGKGFDQRDVDHTRLGLISMRERTELLDGTFHIDSIPGKGTVVSAWFPHNNPDNPPPPAGS